MKNGLILIAHGSMVSSSNKEVYDLLEKIKQSLTNDYSYYKIAYLDCVNPTIEEVLLQLRDAGVSEISVFNYFLVNGKHVKVDIPNKLEKFREENKEIKIINLGYLGQSEFMQRLLLEILAK